MIMLSQLNSSMDAEQEPESFSGKVVYVTVVTTQHFRCGKGAERKCRDKDPSCAEWAEYGECQNNPEWMLPNCQLSCRSCEKEQTETRTDNIQRLQSGPPYQFEVERVTKSKTPS
ncbi:shTK domain protein [Ancylostoma duodenale]|uniref:ShTK domain protein n=1 Tax=Ancylostoma duodenale TaxID=51022 RepID=A0A0C2DSK2_9BILA|nr:shTK domain protein [Ancylostoma duodenale]